MLTLLKFFISYFLKISVYLITKINNLKKSLINLKREVLIYI